MIDYLNTKWWIAIIVFFFLLVFDQYFSIVENRIYRKISQNADVYISKRNIRRQILLFFIGSVSMFAMNAIGPGFFEFIAGAYLLLWLYIDLQRVHNIVFFGDARASQNISSFFSFPIAIQKHASALVIMNQTALFFVIALLTMRPFFGGGAFIFFIQSFKSYQVVKQEYHYKAGVTNTQKDT